MLGRSGVPRHLLWLAAGKWDVCVPAPQEMMRGMDSETLAGLMNSSGLNMTPEQAKQMVDKLGSVRCVVPGGARGGKGGGHV